MATDGGSVEDLSHLDYADSVSVVVLLVDSMMAADPELHAVWSVELPANTGGVDGPPLDTRLLTAGLIELPASDPHGGACCGGRPYAISTRQSQVAIGPSGGSTEILLEMAGNAADAVADGLLGAAGLAVLSKLARKLSARSEYGPPSSATSSAEAEARARALIEGRFDASELKCVLIVDEPAKDNFEFEFLAPRGVRYGAQVCALDDHLIAVTKVWRRTE